VKAGDLAKWTAKQTEGIGGIKLSNNCNVECCVATIKILCIFTVRVCIVDKHDLPFRQ